MLRPLQAESLLEIGPVVTKKTHQDHYPAHLQRRESATDMSQSRLQDFERPEDTNARFLAQTSQPQNQYASIFLLPPEITSIIFEMASSVAKVDHERSELVEARPEITISRVCVRWRQVALSCPTIWSRIIIRNWVVERADSAAQLLTYYLTRSRQVPLDITVTIKRPPHQLKSCTGEIHRFLHTVLPHSLRWRRLALWIDGGYSIGPFVCLQTVAVPQLEVFEVATCPPPPGGPHPSYEAGPDFPTLFQAGAPNLSSALVHSQLHLPLHHCQNVSTLDLQDSYESRPWEDFIALIQLPNLKNLTLGDIFLSPASEPDPLAPRVLARKLRNFRTSSYTIASYMWTTLSAPELTLLVLCHIGGEVALPPNEGCPCRGVFPAVRTLVLWWVDICEPLDLTRLALALPHLTSLAICDCGTDSWDLTETLLAQSRAKDMDLWPHLKTLVYVEGSGPGPRFKFFDLIERERLSYKKARETLFQLVDWRLEAFGHECTLMVGFPNNFCLVKNPFLETRVKLPLFDGSEEEYRAWQKLFLPKGHQIIPWPEEETIGFSSREKVRFSNAAVRRSNL